MIETADMNRLLLAAEAKIHRQGWDQNAFLAILIQPRPGILAMVQIGVDIPNPPGHAVYALGSTMQSKPEIAGHFIADFPDIEGIAFVYEGWTSPTDLTPQERAQETRRWADVPGAKETRMISIVDLWGRHFAIQRVRGEKPVCYQNTNGFDLVGNVHTGLQMVVTAIATALPDNAEMLAGLAKSEKLMARHQADLD